MKKTALFIIISTIISCKSMVYNLALEKMGAYDEKIDLINVKKHEKEIVFFPMVHISTELYYNDVKTKIDSLLKKDFYFYYEEVKGDKNQDTIARKIKKVQGSPFSERGYVNSIETLLKIKFKKKVVNQPPYETLGLNVKNSKNVDATLKDIVNYYENKYGSIILEPCDFDTTIYQETTCENNNYEKSKYESTFINSRNNVVLQELDTEMKTKIAIIYGKAHYDGIKEGLLKRGFIVTEE